MITIGIDPGKKGCLCVLDNDTPTFFDWPKDGNIILMHDIHERTVKAVEKIIPMLKEDGYELVTVSELRDIQLLRDKMKTNQ